MTSLLGWFALVGMRQASVQTTGRPRWKHNASLQVMLRTVCGNIQVNSRHLERRDGGNVCVQTRCLQHTGSTQSHRRWHCVSSKCTSDFSLSLWTVDHANYRTFQDYPSKCPLTWNPTCPNAPSQHLPSVLRDKETSPFVRPLPFDNSSDPAPLWTQQ